MKKPKPTIYDFQEISDYIKGKYDVDMSPGQFEKDYLRWLCDQWDNVGQNTVVYMTVKVEYLEKGTPKWVKDITAFLEKEFLKNADSEGTIEVRISW